MPKFSSKSVESIGGISVDTDNEDDDNVLKKSMYRTSLEALTDVDWQESRVLIFYTGGTIGMTKNTRGKLAPNPGELEARIRKYPHMHDEEYAKERFGGLASPPLVLPDCREKRRVVYWVYEYSPLLDSSNMTMEHWSRIGNDIKTTYEDFDGFVILHGTDTLAYTASALSFMLENLGKPVVITGSQIPLFETRSDGRDNFIGSLIMAGCYSNIPEVTVFFNSKLFRGNRTAKVSTGRLNAFDSPNFSPLATAGISISVDYRSIFRPTALVKFDVFSNLSHDVALLRIFPSISSDTVKSFLANVKGAVIQTYGSGNIPSNRMDILEAMSNAANRGVIIINITQCMHGGVEAIYETGEAMVNAGVLSGFDMTPEAALAKLSYVIGKDIDLETKKKMMLTSLRGEMTVTVSDEDGGIESDLAVDDIIESIGKALEMNSAVGQLHLQEILVPTLFLNAVQNSDITRMNQLIDHVEDLNQTDAMGTTYLHVAVSEGQLEVVMWLLQHGALVHVKDLKGHTPLWVAVACELEKIIKLLVVTGAHLTELPTRVGEALVSAGAAGNTKKISSFLTAGVNIDQQDNLGRTSLHAACVVGATEMVEFLLGRGASSSREDKIFMTPTMCAQANHYTDIVNMCKEHFTSQEHSPTV
uniref:asparaginase n=1 Tax=Hirondellea gigas TaxID=1518452 RepID=A0A2P2HVG8_9CRUS